jgi:hypothetical protein
MLPRLVCTAFVVALLCAPAGAEKDDHRGEAPEPALHIRLVVVPAVFPPRHKDRDHNEAAVIYSLSPSAEKYSITEELRSITIGGTRQEQVRLTTVVLR